MPGKTQRGSSAHAAEIRSCACCSVKFRGNLCPQCYVAGCAHKGKGKPCRMNSDTQKTQQMTEFQVREAYATLLGEHRELVDATQKLSRAVAEKNPELLTGFDSLFPNKPNGHAEFPPQRLNALKASRGETQHA